MNSSDVYNEIRPESRIRECSMTRSLSENLGAFISTMGRAGALLGHAASAFVLLLGPLGVKGVDKAVKMQPYYVNGNVKHGARYLPALYGLAMDLSRACPLLRVIGVEGVKTRNSKSNAPVQLFIETPEKPLREAFKPWGNYCPINKLPEDGLIGLTELNSCWQLCVVVAPRKAPCLWTIEDCKALAAQWGDFVTQQLQLFCAIYHLPQQKACGMRWQLGEVCQYITGDEIILCSKTSEFAESFRGLDGTRVEGKVVRIPFKSLDSIEGAIGRGSPVWKANEIEMIGVWRNEADLPRLDHGGILVPTWWTGYYRDQSGHISKKDTSLALTDDREALEVEKEHPECLDEP